MGALKIRRDDQVVLNAGKDKGKAGRVMRVDPARERVWVEGLNVIKRHQRPSQVGGGQQAGGVIEKEASVHVSNVALLDPKDGKPTRVGIARENGKRFRVARRSGERID